jgi:hypothetical protein
VGGKKGIAGAVATLAKDKILLVKDETRMSGIRLFSLSLSLPPSPPPSPSPSLSLALSRSLSRSLSLSLPHLPGLRGPPVLAFMLSIFLFFILIQVQGSLKLCCIYLDFVGLQFFLLFYFFIPGSRLSKALPHLPGMRGPPEDEWCNGYLEEYLDMHGSELPGVAKVLLMCF